MTSFTWHCNATLPLLGCGVDAERISRFKKFETEEAVLPFVFSPREVEWARSGCNFAGALCIAFTCKEALFKALGHPYDYPLFEVFPQIPPEALVHEPAVALGRPFLQTFGISCTMSKTIWPQDEDYVISSVLIFGGVPR